MQNLPSKSGIVGRLVSQTESTHRAVPDSYRLVRDAVAGADRRRRTRDASRRLWRVAPLVAAVCLAVAAGSRWAGWSAIVPLRSLAIGAIGLTAYAVVSRRRHAISDSAAAEIDTDASLRGELRSASWFAARETGSDWADFHLDRAAARLQATDWAQLYPVGRANRSRLATSVMIIAALALIVITFPGRPGILASASARRPPRGDARRAGPAH